MEHLRLAAVQRARFACKTDGSPQLCEPDGLRVVNANCPQCGGGAFETRPELECMETCVSCGCMRKLLTEDDINADIPAQKSTTGMRFAGGDVSRIDTDSMLFKDRICVLRGKDPDRFVAVSDDLAGKVAAALADRTLYPRRRRTSKLFAQVLIEIGAQMSVAIPRATAAAMFSLGDVSGARAGRVPTCPDIIATKHFAACIAVAEKWIALPPVGFQCMDALKAVHAKLADDLRGPRRCIKFVTQYASLCGTRGVCCRNQVPARTVGACGVLLHCWGYPSPNWLADATGSRKSQISAVMRKMEASWVAFRRIHDELLVPYPPGQPGTDAANAREERARTQLRALARGVPAGSALSFLRDMYFGE